MSDRSPSLVAQVVPYYPPHVGGMEVVAAALAEGLAEAGPVVVLTSRAGADGAAHVERRGDLVVRRLFTIEAAHLPFMPTLLFHLLRLPRRAIVHVHIAQAYTPEAVWLAAVLRRRPFIAHFHLDVEPSGRFGFLFAFYKRHLLGRTLRAAAHVVALSPDQAQFLEHRYHIRASNITVVPNGVGRQFYSEAGPTMRPAGEPLRLLYVGRLAPQKNVARLIAAMAAVSRRVDLAIVGDGEDRKHLESLIAELGLANVTLIGPQRGQGLVDWYRWADAFVLPSDKEGMPLVILEAMAAGLPIIATDVAGIRDTVREDGILVDPNPASLAAAIDRVAADPTLRSELARRSRSRAQLNAWPALVERVAAVYETAGAR
jgi:glycosyltransferase involved in cell wall biosynthesis